MLSRNLVKKDDNEHLKNVLAQINVPKITDEIGIPRNFRRSVVDRLEKGRMEELLEMPDEKNTKKQKRWCKCKKSSEDGPFSETNVVWRRMECKTPESFKIMLNSSIASSLNCIRSLKAINQALSYWPDSNPDLEGLSIIGSYMWLLSFSVQHLLDDYSGKPKISTLPEVQQIRIKFQEIAQSGEIFAELMGQFHIHTHRIRLDACQMVKKMIKKWDFTTQSPFIKRPELHNYLCRPTKRRLGNGLTELADESENIHESLFHLNWTPLTVVLKSSKVDWTQFGSLNSTEKLHLFYIFAQKTFDILESTAEDLTQVTGQISFIQLGEDDTNEKSHARELSSSMLHYAKTCTAPKNPKSGEKNMMLKYISEYWFAVDILHEESYKLLRLVNETRDIIRTCYVYMDVFYKWNMPSYDVFLTAPSNTNKKDESHTMKNIRQIWSKFTSRETGEKKLSDVSEMLVMMDFSTSAYQRIVQNKPIEAEGIFMKLELQNFERRSVEFGLVSGVDKRKSSIMDQRKSNVFK